MPGRSDAILGAKDSYTDLTGQLLGAKDKREAFMKNLIGLVYLIAEMEEPA